MSDYMYEPSNREKVRANNRGCNYCPGCDRALVQEGAKCHVCGRPTARKRQTMSDSRKQHAT